MLKLNLVNINKCNRQRNPKSIKAKNILKKLSNLLFITAERRLMFVEFLIFYTREVNCFLKKITFQMFLSDLTNYPSQPTPKLKQILLGIYFLFIKFMNVVVGAFYICSRRGTKQYRFDIRQIAHVLDCIFRVDCPSSQYLHRYRP